MTISQTCHFDKIKIKQTKITVASRLRGRTDDNVMWFEPRGARRGGDKQSRHCSMERAARRSTRLNMYEPPGGIRDTRQIQATWAAELYTPAAATLPRQIMNDASRQRTS